MISRKQSYSYLISHGSLSKVRDAGLVSDRWGPRNSFKPANGWRCKASDQVEMILDLNKYEIRYVIPSTYNDKGVIAFEDIEKTSYRAAIAMHDYDDKIEFISYYSQ